MNSNLNSNFPEHREQFVYVLFGNNNKTYTGCTSNLEKRLKRHNDGNVLSTKDKRPLKLITYISFSDKYKAFEFEKYLKSGSGRAFLNKRLI